MRRKRGMLEEFSGPCLDHLHSLTLPQLPIWPKYGATCAIFPIDNDYLNYLTLSWRNAAQVALVRDHYTVQGMVRDPSSVDAEYTGILHFDMKDVQPSLAGPTGLETLDFNGIGDDRGKRLAVVGSADYGSEEKV